MTNGQSPMGAYLTSILRQTFHPVELLASHQTATINDRLQTLFERIDRMAMTHQCLEARIDEMLHGSRSTRT